MNKTEITKEQYHLNKKHFIRNSEIFYSTIFDRNGFYVGYKHEVLSSLSDIIIKNKNEKIAGFCNEINGSEEYIMIDNFIKRKVLSVKKVQRRDIKGRFKKSVHLVKYEEF